MIMIFFAILVFVTGAILQRMVDKQNSTAELQ